MFACRFSTVTPQSFVLGGQSSSAMWVQGLGEGEGSARVLTSVADSFLGASWHAGIPWMGISEHMSKTFNANEDIYSFDVRLKEVLQLFTHSSNFKAWDSRPHRVTVQIQSVVFILYFILLCTVDLKLPPTLAVWLEFMWASVVHIDWCSSAVNIQTDCRNPVCWWPACISFQHFPVGFDVTFQIFLWAADDLHSCFLIRRGLHKYMKSRREVSVLLWRSADLP